MSKGVRRRAITDSASDAVVSAVAAAADCGPLDLDAPLYDAIDPDALDATVDSAGSDRIEVSFTYCGYAVTVDGEFCYVAEEAGA